MRFSRLFLPLLVIAAFAAPAIAQTVSLYCVDQKGLWQNNLYVDVDYSTSRVTWRFAMPAHRSFGPVAARITDHEITWNGVGSQTGVFYRIDRITGELSWCDKDDCGPPSICQPANTVKPKF